MAERSNAAVLKTVDGQLSGGSNPSLCATMEQMCGLGEDEPAHLLIKVVLLCLEHPIMEK